MDDDDWELFEKTLKSNKSNKNSDGKISTADFMKIFTQNDSSEAKKNKVLPKKKTTNKSFLRLKSNQTPS